MYEFLERFLTYVCMGKSMEKSGVAAAGGGGDRVTTSFCFDDSWGNTNDNRILKMVEEVAASAKSLYPKMMVLTTDKFGQDLAYVKPTATVDKWDAPGGMKEVLQAEYAQFIPFSMPPFTADKFSSLCILCDEEACLKPHVRINAMASRLLGTQVVGGVLRGVVVVAPGHPHLVSS